MCMSFRSFRYFFSSFAWFYMRVINVSLKTGKCLEQNLERTNKQKTNLETKTVKTNISSFIFLYFYTNPCIPFLLLQNHFKMCIRFSLPMHSVNNFQKKKAVKRQREKNICAFILLFVRVYDVSRVMILFTFECFKWI